MISPLESNPKMLEKIGLFVVLFSGIEFRLSLEFYWVINQRNTQLASVLDFLSSQDFSKKLDMLKLILGDVLYKKIFKINEFRNFIAHGMFGVNSLETVSITKQIRNTRKYKSVELNKTTLDKYIGEEREILSLLHALVLERIEQTRVSK